MSKFTTKCFRSRLYENVRNQVQFYHIRFLQWSLLSINKKEKCVNAWTSGCCVKKKERINRISRDYQCERTKYHSWIMSQSSWRKTCHSSRDDAFETFVRSSWSQNWIKDTCTAENPTWMEQPRLNPLFQCYARFHCDK